MAFRWSYSAIMHKFDNILFEFFFEIMPVLEVRKTVCRGQKLLILVLLFLNLVFWISLLPVVANDLVCIVENFSGAIGIAVVTLRFAQYSPI